MGRCVLCSSLLEIEHLCLQGIYLFCGGRFLSVKVLQGNQVPDDVDPNQNNSEEGDPFERRYPTNHTHEEVCIIFQHKSKNKCSDVEECKDQVKNDFIFFHAETF